MGIDGIGGSVKVVDAFDELVQEGGAIGAGGAIRTEQAAGAAAASGPPGQLGAVREVAGLYTLGIVGATHADFPQWKPGGAGAVGLLRGAAAPAELRATRGAGAFETVGPGHGGAVGPAWSLG